MERSFFLRDTEIVAEQLIGCCLIRTLQNQELRLRITETEAYKGTEDPASHAYRGVTKRNHLMFGEVGLIYVYLIYGMHHCINIVAHEYGATGAVLIRAGVLEPCGTPVIGPGRLTKALNVDLSANGVDLFDLENPMGIRMEQGIAERTIQRTQRIGISKGIELLWRFVET